MINIELDIVSLFADEINSSFTINQIAKSLKRSYASVNKYTQGLIRIKILKKMHVGSAILCSLNYSNPKTIAYLVMNSIGAARPGIPEEAICAVKVKEKPYLYPRVKAPGYISLDKQGILNLLKSGRLGDCIILKGHEAFWRLVAEIAY